jgi:hypothetical protein
MPLSMKPLLTINSLMLWVRICRKRTDLYHHVPHAKKTSSTCSALLPVRPISRSS